MDSDTPTPQPKKNHRTRYGEGSFRYSTSRGLWVGRIDTGEYSPKGTRIVIAVSARDEDKAWQKFVAARKDFQLNGYTLGLKTNQTVRGWAEEWQKSRRGTVRAKTLQTDASNIKNWIIPTIGGTKLSKLTAAHMRAVGDAPLEAGRSLSTANSAQRTLSKLLHAAVAEGYKIPDMIFAAEKKPLGKTTRTAMSIDELKAVMGKAIELHPDAVRFVLAIVYGSRQSEVLGLTWDDVRVAPQAPDALVVGTIRLWRQVQQLPYDKERRAFQTKLADDVEHIVDAWHFVPTKTLAGQRELPLIAPVALMLERWRTMCPAGAGNPHNLVFPRISGKPQYMGYPRSKRADMAEWKALQKAANVYKRRPNPAVEGDEGDFYLLHEARHSMISLLAEAGAPRHVIEALVGQSKLVDSYVHISAEAAGSVLSDVFMPLLPSGE
ncbi:tyrosine-type recombinase/integrase family protein [Arcanobacterium haemolyticum]|nr:tyrosine-type recombinase/integrase family protein [Arcanobacterium haemolyticum]